MKLSMRLISAVLLLFMIFVATGMGPVSVEARTCESQSHRFKGPCVSENNCANVCHNEGFGGGKCRGLRRRCFCTRHC
ncbi:hypothetical protein BRARA_B03089 [Brassica rapa]|uniref:BnaA02g26210D protein n=4 Tax=Brassica TaxID=3705 RepID=A0A078F8N6_BRANA|nr:defensin-like protein 1 [Brassica rapa]XP_022572233.1 defensin-like protein 1 [Brassica napus]XP_048599798.1 defensin-like protein 1 [Brassica napus]KAG5411579.1 hypothetical protein IGI04_007898 [Brassica rapa subsp. trilocularis]KAH0847090.1 hypothetical protein HID58_090509 [Brassica napus]KAH0939615.1 hypothetical protein HID58_007076 [Brassica napus]RID76097.1 hypothetical protein BRARA_B03089 [Brassica rapa]CAF2143078.1 unnamed protein product [Brassica napus]